MDKYLVGNVCQWIKGSVWIGVLALVLLLPASNARALISVTGDIPLVYGIKEPTLSGNQKISGVKLGVSLPIFVGMAVEKHTIKGTASASHPNFPNQIYQLDLSLYDLYFDLPVPKVNIGFGFGMGRGHLNFNNDTTRYKVAGLGQSFLTLGYPFLGFFDVHLGYHMIRGTSSQSNLKDQEIGGKMYTLGARFGF